MAQDPYSALGVSRDATQEEIKQAFRTLAKQLHPDLNPGDRDAEARFKEATGAYCQLSAPARRARVERSDDEAGGTEGAGYHFWPAEDPSDHIVFSSLGDAPAEPADTEAG